MTGDGLFFTGVVYKRNLDLFAQQATRDQLKIQKEELELRKQEAVERRKKLREAGKVQPKDYSLDNMDPFLAEQFQSQVNNYTDFVRDNSLDIKDSNELTSQQSKLESDLALNGNKYRSISTDLTSLNNVAVGQNKGNLKLAEDGETYLYQYNYQKIQEEVNSGNMTLDQALEAYPIDPESMVKKSDFVPFYQALIDADDANPEKMYEQGEYNMTGISDGQKTDTTSQIASKLKVNANNNHNDDNAGQVYNNEMVEGPDGSRISGKQAFFLEAYVDPDTDVKGGITAPSQDLMDQLDPKSENFNRALSDQYAEYLAGKISERGYRDKKDRRSSKVSGRTTSGEGLSQEDIDFLTGPSKSTLSYGNVQFKFDAGMYDDVTDRNIEVNIVPESLLSGQGELQEFFEKQYKDEVGDTNKSVKGQVTRLGLTADNVKVASVKFGKKEYLIPYESISSEIAELKKTSVGYKIGQFESGSAPQGYDTSKYNKE
jgi:hypothetical protein